MTILLKHIFTVVLLGNAFLLSAQTRVKTYPAIQGSYSNKSILLSNANNETVQTLLKEGDLETVSRMNKSELDALLQMMKGVRAYTERIRRGERLTYADEVQIGEQKVQLTKYITYSDVDYVFCISSTNQEACIGLKAPKLSHLNELYREIYRDLFDLSTGSTTLAPINTTPLTLNQEPQAIEATKPPASTDVAAQEIVYQSVEEPPVLIGGIPALLANLKYPEDASRNNIEGTVLIGFMVDETGTVRNPKIIQSLGYGCDEEAMHLVENARFLPGLKHGNPVKVQMFMPFQFSIEENQGN